MVLIRLSVLDPLHREQSFQQIIKMAWVRYLLSTENKRNEVLFKIIQEKWWCKNSIAFFEF